MNNGTVASFITACVLWEETPTPVLRFTVYFFVGITYSLPVFLGVALCYACFWRDTHTIYVLCATVMNAMWVVTVKELTRIDRPRPYCDAVAYLGHSMPSLFVSVSVFLSTYYVCQFWRHARDVWTTKTLILRIACCLGYMFLICYSRVYLVMARPEDVLVGSVIGSSTTIAFLLVLKRQRYTNYKSLLKKEK